MGVQDEHEKAKQAGEASRRQEELSKILDEGKGTGK